MYGRFVRHRPRAASERARVRVWTYTQHWAAWMLLACSFELGATVGLWRTCCGDWPRVSRGRYAMGMGDGVDAVHAVRNPVFLLFSFV